MYALLVEGLDHDGRKQIDDHLANLGPATPARRRAAVLAAAVASGGEVT